MVFFNGGRVNEKVFVSHSNGAFHFGSLPAKPGRTGAGCHSDAGGYCNSRTHLHLVSNTIPDRRKKCHNKWMQ